MGIIKILDESLSNMIAAGEVVENPASLIKELLENSLDADSKYIRIDVKNGGKNIKFTDDGKGMSREDLLLCIERHATSKISSKDDLFNLTTYGFRGEALSSIAAVSKMIIATKRKDDSLGYCINVSAGKITNLKEIQKGFGTEIEIKDLFFNTPARLKFLRKDATENTKIKEIVLQEALANPNVSITLNIDGKENIRTSGKGIENTIIEIFGLSTLKNLKSVEFGYIGNLSLTRSTKDFIFTFVNNRPVKAKIIEEAIIDGYYTHLMKGKYPFAIVNLKIDPKTIDVNVHPSKKIIKFSDENKIYHEIFSIIESSLNFNKDFSMPIFEAKKESFNFEDIKISNNSKKTFENFEINDIKRVIEIKKENISSFENNNDSIIKENLFKENNSKKEEKNILPKIEITKLQLDISTPKEKIKISPFLEKNSTTTSGEQPNEAVPSIPLAEETKLEIPKNLRIIGQFSNSFILVEEDGELIVYDQHIVHERILYEKLKKEYSQHKVASQALLVPIKISLTLKQIDILKDKIHFFEDFGFEIDQFNDLEFLIRAVPSLNTKDSFENIFFETLEGLNKVNSKNEVIENMIISMSCRGAIKANEKLSINEMEKLILELHQIGRFTCPHGRPITFKISLLDMEKGFKRK
ncbi:MULTISPECIES: DNA mismatch repair endonuclease MutL [Cetobacterium]|uniref:DNA mismatch repair protein MutL n=1 Tax=Candidatus Cetobacterium colombiensis TaxID=3073100 RepID=A0ABU4WB11_9FUSO|nr:DNA mismatch repair endonuclease MutL [Candidatus Cetobacterium colombiensis]MDX8336217.1 DNA mismatch repair endonuclease MutL [Candidatus Cetobacterium colombiensis]